MGTSMQLCVRMSEVYLIAAQKPICMVNGGTQIALTYIEQNTPQEPEHAR